MVSGETFLVHSGLVAGACSSITITPLPISITRSFGVSFFSYVNAYVNGQWIEAPSAMKNYSLEAAQANSIMTSNRKIWGTLSTDLAKARLNEITKMIESTKENRRLYAIVNGRRKRD